MKNLLIVVPSLAIGGRERIAVNTAECLKKFYDLKLIVFQHNSVTYDTDCDVICFDYPAQDSVLAKVVYQIKRICKLVRYRAQMKADIVYSLGMTANITNVVSGLLSQGRSIIAIHGFAEVQKSFVNSFIYKHADNVVCISQEIRHQLLKLYPKFDHTVVIENGYDLSKIQGYLSRRIFDRNTPRLIAMGRLEDVKRYDLLLKAFSVVKKSIPGATFSLMGQGKQENELKKLTKELNLESNVLFLGYCESPYKNLAENDIFILTSKNEGFPNALIEAMACGLAVVSVDCLSGPREILSDSYSPTTVTGIRFEKYGVLVENTNNEEQLIAMMAEAILKLINKPEQLQRYQMSGWSRANMFTMDVYRNKLCSLFEGQTK